MFASSVTTSHHLPSHTPAPGARPRSCCVTLIVSATQVTRSFSYLRFNSSRMLAGPAGLPALLSLSGERERRRADEQSNGQSLENLAARRLSRLAIPLPPTSNLRSILSGSLFTPLHQVTPNEEYLPPEPQQKNMRRTPQGPWFSLVVILAVASSSFARGRIASGAVSVGESKRQFERRLCFGETDESGCR